MWQQLPRIRRFGESTVDKEVKWKRKFKGILAYQETIKKNMSFGLYKITSVAVMAFYSAT